LEESIKLSSRVRRRVDGELAGDGLTVSAVTFWEMRLKERRGLIEPKTPVEGWPRVLSAHAGFRIVATSPAVWIRSAELSWVHKDPADRIIAATALALGVPVVTVDGKFHWKDSPVEAVW
jgi:PIN domain nuclease of toxin-antitoxin system